jgi:putative addiction module component (TIGR02574 family)
MPSNLYWRLLDDALRSPDDQRAALAAALIESLDKRVEANAEAAWSAEIARRLQDVQCGAANTVPWSEARLLIVAEERPDV